MITALELGAVDESTRAEIVGAAASRQVPVLGITGTGGSGKSSLTDELLRRFRQDQGDKLRLAVIAVDPTRRRTGGALLGDRIRMNAVDGSTVFFRSLATRSGASEVPDCLDDVVSACKAAGFDLVIVETPGIGQGDAGIADHVDTALYVMTPEFGAASQLEKIDMLDLADVVAINKFDRRGGEDALRDVRRQFVRDRELFGVDPDELPVFGTIASRFNDDGVTALYQHLRSVLGEQGLPIEDGQLAPVDVRASSGTTLVVPPERSRYLAEIAGAIRGHHSETRRLADAARAAQRLAWSADHLSAEGLDLGALPDAAAAARREVPDDLQAAIEGWPAVVEQHRGTDLARISLSGTPVPRVAVPTFADDGDLVTFLRSENLPGRFPFTAGVFPLKREGEDPTRMFAGEGDAFRTNRRFHMLSADMPATRLSTAFDSVTLYGFDPAERPDIYGKVGNAGVSICTLDDMKALYDGFDLCDPTTSVSMTINGPAPTVLAMFLNAVIDQQLAGFADEHGRPADPAEAALVRAEAVSTVRGTVQADVLKEDQGQNTCILSTEFALRLMSDVQEWFVANQVRNFYSVSISGYHIAEAGANPISQLAFTLANGFTYVESFLARGMSVDDFAPNLSFFFSNGMDPEYTVLGRVARRIWAVAMRDRYGANERSQKLKYHVQTSGRSLHAQEMDFNDIRTTLQALIAVYDNCNSLHTNAFDEAVTTPDRAVGASGHGDPAHHQPRVGPRRQREPEPGRLRDRGAHRPRRGGRAARVRADQRARRRPRRHGARLPTRPHPGRVDALRAAQARRLAADHRGQHLHPRHRGRRGDRRRGTGPLDRRGEAAAAPAAGGVPAYPRRRAAPRPRSRPTRGAGRRQRLRRAHGGGPVLQPGRDHRGPLRGRRPLPAQRLTTEDQTMDLYGRDRAS